LAKSEKSSFHVQGHSRSPKALLIEIENRRFTSWWLIFGQIFA